MKLDFYGVKLNPPTKETARHFGSLEKPKLLRGGQGTSYRSGTIMLKPADSIERAVWMANIFVNLPESNEVRFARPKKSLGGEWVHDGYVAWDFLGGEHVKGQYQKKLSASRAFHGLLKHVPQPDFLKIASSSWSAADQVVWQERKFNYDQEFMELIDQIKPHLKPIRLPSQLIHGDLSGNFLVSENLPAAVIDFSPAWAPDGFAEGIMLADAITWENADRNELEAFKEIPCINQLAWRGVFRRIAEQAEHIEWLNKNKDQATKDACVFQKTIDYLNQNFS